MENRKGLFLQALLLFRVVVIRREMSAVDGAPRVRSQIFRTSSQGKTAKTGPALHRQKLQRRI